MFYSTATSPEDFLPFYVNLSKPIDELFFCTDVTINLNPEVEGDEFFVVTTVMPLAGFAPSLTFTNITIIDGNASTSAIVP